MVEDEFDSELKVITNAFFIAEGVGKGRTVSPNTRYILDRMIKDKADNLFPATKMLTKQEVRYLVGAYRLLNKIIEMRARVHGNKHIR